MPFEKLTHTKINKKTGQPLSKNTTKIYTGLLNRLALAGIDTRQKLIEEHTFVIDLLQTIHDEDTSGDKDIKRKYFSAIFYALDETPLLARPYYDAFQLCKEYKDKETKKE